MSEMALKPLCAQPRTIAGGVRVSSFRLHLSSFPHV
jgi:hypothetical protein